MAAKVTLNHKAMQDLLDGGGGVREVLRGKAESVAAAGRSSAPVKTGNYRDRITVAEDHTDRLVFRVGSTAPHAHLVEAKHGILARALDAAGGS
jgi:hypothetical protein